MSRSAARTQRIQFLEGQHLENMEQYLSESPEHVVPINVVAGCLDCKADCGVVDPPGVFDFKSKVSICLDYVLFWEACLVVSESIASKVANLFQLTMQEVTPSSGQALSWYASVLLSQNLESNISYTHEIELQRGSLIQELEATDDYSFWTKRRLCLAENSMADIH